MNGVRLLIYCNRYILQYYVFMIVITQKVPFDGDIIRWYVVLVEQ
jgi:hypothetical protein